MSCIDVMSDENKIANVIFLLLKNVNVLCDNKFYIGIGIHQKSEGESPGKGGGVTRKGRESHQERERESPGKGGGVTRKGRESHQEREGGGGGGVTRKGRESHQEREGESPGKGGGVTRKGRGSHQEREGGSPQRRIQGGGGGHNGPVPPPRPSFLVRNVNKCEDRGPPSVK